MITTYTNLITWTIDCWREIKEEHLLELECNAEIEREYWSYGMLEWSTEYYHRWLNNHFLKIFLVLYYANKYAMRPWLRAKKVRVPYPGLPKNVVDVLREHNLILDPLEQFDVLAVFPVFHLTNLGLLMGLNLLVLACFFGMFRISGRTTYDFTLRSLYQLVRSMTKENIYIRKQQYFSVLFYLFNTLLLANLVGLIPYSFTITSSFVVTFFLALTHFLAINMIASVQHRWQIANMFLPSGAPLPIAPFLAFIEAVSYIARVFSLSIRLFANMMSGHALLKILIGFSWAMLACPMLAIVATLPWAIVTAISFLELLIAFLQAYVFVILISLYINDVLTLHD